MYEENKRKHARLMLSLIVMYGRVVTSEGQTGTKKADAVCEPETVITGSNASLTCKYTFEMLENKRSFYIALNQPGVSIYQQDMILICDWSEGQLKCTDFDGYNFDYNVLCSVNIKIPVAKKSFSGVYKCGIEGYRDMPECSMSVEDPTSTVSGTENEVLETSTETREDLTTSAWSHDTCYGPNKSVICLLMLILIVCVLHLGLSLMVNLYPEFMGRLPKKYCRCGGTRKRQRGTTKDDIECRRADNNINHTSPQMDSLRYPRITNDEE